MSNASERLRALQNERNSAWEEARRLLEDCEREHRDMDGTEQAEWDRINARIDRLDTESKMVQQREENERIAGEIRAGLPDGFAGTSRLADEGSELRRFLLGEGAQSMNIDLGRAAKERNLIRDGASGHEARALAWDTGSAGSVVPVSMARNLYEYLEAEVFALRGPATKIVTDSGENMDFPKVAAHGIATQVAGQGTLLAGTDPTFDKLTLGATKFAQLVIVASEVIDDASVDIASFLGRDLGRSVGRLVDQRMVSGPSGITNAATACGSVTTGGSLITPTYESLIDTQFQIADSYRARSSAGWLMKDSTAGTIRKLRDGAGGTEGYPLWQPSTNIMAGQPDMLLGHPAWTDPNVAAQGSNARVLYFADWNSYYVRTVGQVNIEVDRSRWFDTDQVGVRAKLRADGGLIDDNALVSLLMNV